MLQQIFIATTYVPSTVLEAIDARLGGGKNKIYTVSVHFLTHSIEVWLYEGRLEEKYNKGIEPLYIIENSMSETQKLQQ